MDKKILKDEDVTAKFPVILPLEFTQEVLGGVWKNFVGLFHDPSMKFSQDSHPEAYNLLNSF
jgi:hypothetical protein